MYGYWESLCILYFWLTAWNLKFYIDSKKILLFQKHFNGKLIDSVATTKPGNRRRKKCSDANTPLFRFTSKLCSAVFEVLKLYYNLQICLYSVLFCSKHHFEITILNIFDIHMSNNLLKKIIVWIRFEILSDNSNLQYTSFIRHSLIQTIICNERFLMAISLNIQHSNFVSLYIQPISVTRCFN